MIPYNLSATKDVTYEHPQAAKHAVNESNKQSADKNVKLTWQHFEKLRV